MRTSLVLAPIAALAFAPAVFGAKKEPTPPPLPPPDVELRVEPRPGKPWKLEVVNKGSIPLRITADIRLVRLTIVPPPDATLPPKKKGQKPKPPPSVDCVLPSVMRTADRTLLIPAGGKWSEEFDPRLHCLDRVDKLIDGATVTARLGWAAPKKGPIGPPFAVIPSASIPGVAAAKEIAAASVALDSMYYPPPISSANGPIVAEGGAARSFAFGKDVETTILIRNVDKSAHSIYPRPQSVDARVINPKGQLVACNGLPIQPAPIVDFVTRLAPKGTWSATVPLKSLCPEGTFDQPGLYQVTPIVHLPPLAALKAKDDVYGDIAAYKPQLVRVETGDKPFYDVPPKLAKP
jgi:hypothetical protein